MDISADCLFHLLSYLGYDDLLRLFTVSRTFYKMGLDDMTWRRLLQYKYPNNIITSLPGVDREKYKDWRQYYEVVHTNSRMYQVKLPFIKPIPFMGYPYIMSSSELDKLIQPIKTKLRRGDIVQFNDGDSDEKFLWSGISLDKLQCDEDDYDVLPLSYPIDEFINPYRWQIDMSAIIKL
jgi:hypothetical protein